MTDLAPNPSAPALARLANVELLQTGTWPISTGVWTVTTEDLRNAVTALECPAIRRPVLKLGHTDPRFDGEPAAGYVDNLAVADEGRTLVGDYAGLPGWLGPILASAYPDRSIEGQYDFRCQMGHTHPFVLTGVALLGVSAPGVGTLASLQDVGRLYGVQGLPDTVAASAAQDAAPAAGRLVAATVSTPGAAMTDRRATVTGEDVIRAFYASPAGEGFAAWVEELQLDPMQIVYVDDETGVRSRVPVSLAEGDGADAISFGDPVRVVIRYEDAPAVAASSGTTLRFASAEASRSFGSGPPASLTPGATDGAGSTQEGSPLVSFTDEQLISLRQRLGIPSDADEATILAALDEALAERLEPQIVPAPLPEGTVTIDALQLEELRVAAKAGADARDHQLREERERTVAAAVSDGRIPPARRGYWNDYLAVDPDAASVLASMAPGLVPVSEVGFTNAPTNPELSSDAATYAALFGSAETS